ncbi:NmrA family NAD(P)-binding protein [Yinghuangia seranimata]|uniref:NmrA family NAD(P)-binding protein n=1 Tax=Yinghuangia seranimata TaxID=408067 RepID=UPI00248B1DB2|nr:NmrA family NAD(P)-binding protein [Yinghuangia seranimata]MDI2129901.1 NmrA family NAD(P)-binding protein [Yinghuangia seranimata]
MITVMGASGATGSALLDSLTALGVPCRALTRDPDRLACQLGDRAHSTWGIEVVGADAADPASLRAAFAGTRALFLAMANSPRQVELELAAVDAAAACGVGHVVKLSAPAAEPDAPVAVSRGHYAVEKRLLESGVAATMLRPYAFMQKLPLLADGIKAGGVIVGAMGDAPCNYIDVRDIADVAAALLVRPPGPAGAVYHLTGPEAVGHAELAARIGRLTGRQIRYIDLPPEAFREHLVRVAGMPDWLAAHVTEIQQLAVSHPERPTGDVEAVLGRPARTLDAYLAENAALFR